MNWRDGRRWVTAAAAVKVVTGLVLIIRRSLFVWLLFRAELSAAGQALGRLAGFSLLALALACWPVRGAETKSNPALRALLAFSLLAAVYLVYVGIGGKIVGILL